MAYSKPYNLDHYTEMASTYFYFIFLIFGIFVLGWQAYDMLFFILIALFMDTFLGVLQLILIGHYQKVVTIQWIVLIIVLYLLFIKTGQALFGYLFNQLDGVLLQQFAAPTQITSVVETALLILTGCFSALFAFIIDVIKKTYISTTGKTIVFNIGTKMCVFICTTLFGGLALYITEQWLYFNFVFIVSSILITTLAQLWRKKRNNTV